MRKTTVYCLRVRGSDSEPWGEIEYYQTRKERDRVAAINRCIGGIRTFSFQENKTKEEAESLCQ